MANANSFPVGSTMVLSYLVKQSLLSHWGRAMMVGVPNIGNVRSFLGISVQDGMIIPKINVWPGVSVLYPPF